MVSNPKPYVGEMVHVHWRGKCVAALIGDFWEDLDIARLHMFDIGGVSLDRRSVRGAPGEDQRWHRLNECPNMEDEDEAPEAPRRGRVRRLPEGADGTQGQAQARGEEAAREATA